MAGYNNRTDYAFLHASLVLRHHSTLRELPDDGQIEFNETPEKSEPGRHSAE